jgi:hypothetical protein
MNDDRDNPPKLHRGINTSSIAGEGLAGVPGLVMTIGFVFIFLGALVPTYVQRAYNNWFLLLFAICEIGGIVLYVRAARRSKRESQRLSEMLHEINAEKTDDKQGL